MAPKIILLLTVIGALTVVILFYNLFEYFCRLFHIGRKKIFIIGITGNLRDNETRKKYRVAVLELAELGFSPELPFIPSLWNPKPGELLRKYSRSVSKCYGVYALEDYAQSLDATEVIKLASAMYMPIIYQAKHRAQIREGQKLPPKSKRWHSFASCSSCGTPVTPANELPDPFRALYNCGGCGLVVNKKGQTYAAKAVNFIN